MPLHSNVILTTPLADELREMKSVFLSQLLFQTYNGYVMSQFKKLERDLRQHQTLKWKHVMHLIRLLLSGGHRSQRRRHPCSSGEGS